MIRSLITIACVVNMLCPVNIDATQNRRHKTAIFPRTSPQEIKAGISLFPILQQNFGGPYGKETEINRYIQEIGQKLVQVSPHQNLPFDFAVVNSSIPNAMTLPGGKVIITRGLLLTLENEAELAAVIGHEIHHAISHHGMKAQKRNDKINSVNDVLFWGGPCGVLLACATNFIGGAVEKSIERVEEKEADSWGLHYLAKAGYDPRCAVNLQKKFLKLEKGEKKDLFSSMFMSHPPGKERIQALNARLKNMPKGGVIGKERYEQALAPILQKRDAYDKYEEGKRALQKKEWDKATNLAFEAIELAPNESLFYGLVGKVQLQRRDWNGAIASFSQAIDLNPNYYDYYQCRSEAYRKIGEEKLSYADLEQKEILYPQ